MTPCFICAQPANAIRSINMLTAPPATQSDAVAICRDCTQDLDFALVQIIRSDLAQETNSTPTDLSFPRHNPQAKL